MNSSSHRRLWSIAVVCLAAIFAAPGALAQDSIIEHMAKMHSGPDEHYFFEADRKQVVDYQTEQVVRICTGESRHTVPLKVSYDDKTTVLGSDDCVRVEAKRVFLEPNEPLEPNWVIQAEVETL